VTVVAIAVDQQEAGIGARPYAESGAPGTAVDVLDQRRVFDRLVAAGPQHREEPGDRVFGATSPSARTAVELRSRVANCGATKLEENSLRSVAEYRR
jgi:hypothetical protein